MSGNQEMTKQGQIIAPAELSRFYQTWNVIFLIFDNFIINIDVLRRQMSGIYEVNELSDKDRKNKNLGDKKLHIWPSTIYKRN